MGEESVGRVAIYSLFSDGITPSVNTSVTPSVILTGNRHVTARTCFSNPSVIPSVFLTVHRSRHPYGSGISNPSVIPSVFLTVNRSNHTYGSPVLNPSVILSEKSSAKTSASATCPFSLILNFLFVIRSVITDRIMDENISSVNSTEKYRQKYSVGI